MESDTLELTEFQMDIAKALESHWNQMRTTWELGQMVRPEMWRNNRQSHPGIVSQVRRAAETCECFGWISGETRWDPGHVTLRDEYEVNSNLQLKE